MPKEEIQKYSKETLNLRLLDSHNNPLKYQEFILFEVIHTKRYLIDKIFTTDEKGECSLNAKEIFKDKTLSFELKLNHSSYYKDKSIFHFRRILRSYEYGHWCEFNFEEKPQVLELYFSYGKEKIRLDEISRHYTDLNLHIITKDCRNWEEIELKVQTEDDNFKIKATIKDNKVVIENAFKNKKISVGKVEIYV